MVFIRETESNLLIAFSERIITWDLKKQGDTVEELKIPEPVVTENLTKEQIEVIKKEKRNITWIEVSKNGQYVAVTTENKQLVVFDKTFQLVKNIRVPRASSKVCFSPTNDILVADGTGDVHLYKIDDETNQPTLLLGHLSVILDMIITDCGKYIITCDRDEKIRVSHFPNAYNIVTYCLGHTEFVMTIKLLKNSPILLSASGDGTVRMWHYLEGKQVSKIETKSLVEEKVLEHFASEMDAEKVDVTNLPITDMQIHEEDAFVIIVVSLHNLEQLHFYKMDSNSLECSYLTNIDTGTKSFSFDLSTFSNTFYISLDGGLMVFLFLENVGISYLSGNFLGSYLKKYKELFVYDSSIVPLYKRKFDNVQEYMERKKQRLQSK